MIPSVNLSPDKISYCYLFHGKCNSLEVFEALYPSRTFKELLLPPEGSFAKTVSRAQPYVGRLKIFSSFFSPLPSLPPFLFSIIFFCFFLSFFRFLVNLFDHEGNYEMRFNDFRGIEPLNVSPPPLPSPYLFVALEFQKR